MKTKTQTSSDKVNVVKQFNNVKLTNQAQKTFLLDILISHR
jgi:hypothetical protein